MSHIKISHDEMRELLDCLDSTADMMEPYYKQNNGAEDAYRLVRKWREKIPKSALEIKAEKESQEMAHREWWDAHGGEKIKCEFCDKIKCRRGMEAHVKAKHQQPKEDDSK